MKIRAILVMLLAAICGISAAVGMNHLRRPGRTTKVATTPVVVAAIDIVRGRMITSDDVKVTQWPKGMLPEGVLVNLEDVLDRVAILPAVAGEPILEGKLADKNAGRGLAALIPKGMRAYSIRCSRVAANVAGFVLPGNRVDVLMTLKGRGNDGTGGGSTTTLLQAVEILAVDQRLDAPADNKVDPSELRSVTLLVTADQAALLDLGQNMGQLTLSLRNPEDLEEARTQPATLAQIRYHQEKPVEPTTIEKLANAFLPKTQKPKTSGILTLRGSRRGQVLIGSQR